MILAIDVGNTNIVLGTIENGEIDNIVRIHTDPRLTGTEYALTLKQIAEFYGFDMKAMEGAIISGIDQDTSRKINKDIKARKYKAKVTIEGDKLRVSSPSRDTLQEIIAFLKEQDYGLPLQFTNYR